VYIIVISVIKLAKSLKDLTLRDLLIIVWPCDGNLYSSLKQCFKRRVMMGKIMEYSITWKGNSKTLLIPDLMPFLLVFKGTL